MCVIYCKKTDLCNFCPSLLGDSTRSLLEISFLVMSSSSSSSSTSCLSSKKSFFFVDKSDVGSMSGLGVSTESSKSVENKHNSQIYSLN